MVTARNKAIFLASIIGLAVIVGVVAATTMESGSRRPPELPVVMVEIVIQEDQREAFFEKLKQFSEKNAFAVRIAPPLPGGFEYLIQLWREDVNITGTNPFEPSTYRIGFYKNDAYGIPPDVLDYLLDDLEKTVCELPGVTFSLMEKD